MQIEGKKLGGRYEIIHRIGGGGMAVVYKAKDLLLNRFVAIKILSESLSNDMEFVRRFSREAQAAASLSHPNIVNVYDVGKDGYTHYIVMELVEGPTLKQYIQERGPLPVEEAVHIAIQICDGLAHAHDNQIVHRDIKPHNILLGKNGRVKVTDFGIARAASSSTITQTGSVMGSVHYFSPEQARGGVISEKSDIYSLGIVLYEMLTGELPFDGDSAVSIALKHLQEPVVDPRKLNPNIPDSVVKICLRALEKDPDMRFPNVRAMMQELKMALEGGRSSSRVGQRKQTDDVFETVPLAGEDTEEETVVAHPRGSGRIKAQNHSEQTAQLTRKVGQQTMTRLEKQLGRRSADKDTTIFQKTVIWLENVQAKLPWWQKILFGLITVAVIGGLTLGAVNVVFKWITGDDGQENAFGSNQQQNVVQCDDYIGTQAEVAEKALKAKGIKVETRYKASEKGKMGEVFDCKNKGDTVILYVKAADADADENGINFVGHWQGDVRDHKSEYEKKYGIKIVVNNHLCSNQNLTGQPFEHGKIIYQYPKPENVKKGDTVYVYVYAPNSPGCNKLPPYLGGEDPSKQL